MKWLTGSASDNVRMLSVMLVGGLVATPLAGMFQTVQPEIRVQNLVLCDSAGKARARLGMDLEKDAVFLKMFDPLGEERVALVVHKTSSATLSLSSSAEFPPVGLHLKGGLRPSISLQGQKPESKAILMVEDEPRLVMLSGQPVSGVLVGFAAGKAGVEFRDDEDRLTYRIPPK